METKLAAYGFGSAGEGKYANYGLLEYIKQLEPHQMAILSSEKKKMLSRGI